MRYDSPLVPSVRGSLADAALGPVHLTVTDLEQSLSFYAGILGLPVAGQAAGRARLGEADGPEVLVLVEEPAARRAGRHAGLYHAALLYPSRLELARVALRLSAAGVPIEGASDHGTHEAIYLPDPDGNGVELAADTPPATWPSYEQEFAQSGPRPLDAAALFALVEGERPTPVPRAGMTVGHVHLHVGDIAAARRFYVDGIGFDLMGSLPSAGFVAAGGYHHHLAFNSWRGQGAPPAPAGTVGLRHWTLLLAPSDVVAARERLTALGSETTDAEGGFSALDPSGNRVLVLAAA